MNPLLGLLFVAISVFCQDIFVDFVELASCWLSGGSLLLARRLSGGSLLLARRLSGGSLLLARRLSGGSLLLARRLSGGRSGHLTFTSGLPVGLLWPIGVSIGVTCHQWAAGGKLTD